jgi:short-subunit dehydrogenase
MKKLEGKVVIVTGASMGIGAAIARLFAAEGARIALVARSLERLEPIARELGPSAVPIRADMSDPGSIREMVSVVAGRFGRIDILVNNAAIGMYTALADTPSDQIEYLIRTNLLGPIHAIQAVVPIMRKQRRGQIINISSVAGEIAIPWMSTYCATKFALNAMSFGLRTELADDNIQVVNICPGRIETPFSDNALKDSKTKALGGHKISAERVARAVLRGSLKGKRQVVVPAINRAYIWLYNLAPGLSDKIMATTMRKSMRKD